MGNIFVAVAVLVVWVVCAGAALMVAPEDRAWTFLGLTLFFGPLGILAAAVASPRDPNYFVGEPEPRSIAKGRKRYRVRSLWRGVRPSRTQGFFRAGAAGKSSTWSLNDS
jgi:hypothetical protein